MYLYIKYPIETGRNVKTENYAQKNFSRELAAIPITNPFSHINDSMDTSIGLLG